MGCAPGSSEFGKDVPLDHNFPKEEKHTHTLKYMLLVLLGKALPVFLHQCEK